MTFQGALPSNVKYTETTTHLMIFYGDHRNDFGLHSKVVGVFQTIGCHLLH